MKQQCKDEEVNQLAWKCLGKPTPPTHPPTHSSIHPSIHSFIDPFSHFSSIHPPTHLPTYPLLPGYRYIPTEGRWDSSKVFPKWAARYPEPPDLVGVTRIYEKYVCSLHPPTHPPTYLFYPSTQPIAKLSFSFSVSHPPTHPPTHSNKYREVDAPVKKANTALVRSVPKMYKQSLKELLAPYGFKGR